MGKRGNMAAVGQSKIQKVDDDLDNVNDLDNDIDDDVSDFLIDFNDGDEFMVSVYRSEAGRAKGAYLFQFPLANKRLPELLDELRDSYNGGEFRAFIYNGSKRVANKLLVVEAPAGKNNRDAFGRAVPVSNSSLPVVQSGVTPMDLMMQQLREDAKQARADAAAANERTNTLMMGMIQNMGKSNNQGTSANDVVNLITALNGVKGNAGGGGIKDTIETILAVKGLLGEKDEPAGGSLIDKLVTAATPVLTKMAEAGAFNPQPAVVSDVRTVAAVPERKEQQTAAGDATALIRMMCKAAADDRDPDVYAEVAIDQFGDEQMMQVCGSDENFNMFMAGLPAAVRDNYGQWFIALRDAVIVILAGGDDGGDGNTGQPGQMSDGNDENNSKTGTG